VFGGRDVSGAVGKRVPAGEEGDVCAETPAMSALQSKQEASDNGNRK